MTSQHPIADDQQHNNESFQALHIATDKGEGVAVLQESENVMADSDTNNRPLTKTRINYQAALAMINDKTSFKGLWAFDNGNGAAVKLRKCIWRCDATPGTLGKTRARSVQQLSPLPQTSRT